MIVIDYKIRRAICGYRRDEPKVYRDDGGMGESGTMCDERVRQDTYRAYEIFSKERPYAFAKRLSSLSSALR